VIHKHQALVKDKWWSVMAHDAKEYLSNSGPRSKTMSEAGALGSSSSQIPGFRLEPPSGPWPYSRSVRLSGGILLPHLPSQPSVSMLVRCIRQNFIEGSGTKTQNELIDLGESGPSHFLIWGCQTAWVASFTQLRRTLQSSNILAAPAWHRSSLADSGYLCSPHTWSGWSAMAQLRWRQFV